MQQLQAKAVNGVPLVGGGHGRKLRRSLVAGKFSSGDINGGAKEQQGFPEVVLEQHYQQLQCAEGYTGPLCANCITKSVQNASPGIDAAALDEGRMPYGRYRQSCHRCPAKKSLTVVYYLLARLLDFAIVSVLVALLANERRKRLRKLAKAAKSAAQKQKKKQPQQGQPPRVVRWVIVGGKVLGRWFDAVCPKWLRNPWALTPLMKREQSKLPDKQDLSPDQLVKVGSGCRGTHK
jgi:hypothetical protein